MMMVALAGTRWALAGNRLGSRLDLFLELVN